MYEIRKGLIDNIQAYIIYEVRQTLAGKMTEKIGYRWTLEEAKDVIEWLETK